MDKVKGYRVWLGLTQKEMASKLGISRQAYSDKENGKYSFNDREKEIIRDLFKEVSNDITIDEIFFSKKVAKSFEGDG
ncbi:transcriptional regulator [Alkalibacterium psychrotolerans]